MTTTTRPGTITQGYESNPTVRAVQSELAKLGYYHGPIDGVMGDATEAALARYQEDHDLSVTGTVTSTTLQAIGLQNLASH
jgi:N-acetylmuramoyl-L-alanine amidase